jgi:dienelactone hydrolase
MREDTEESVTVPVGRAELTGDLSMPYRAGGLIVFAHASGRGRERPRNRLLTEAFHQAGLATFLFDLLTEEEEGREQQGAQLRFDIPLLAGRLGAVTAWLALTFPTCGLPIGYLGAGTGAAAALIAAADRPDAVRAVVSHGGRPDFAGEWLPRVQAPTLLIVGAADLEGRRQNEEALRSMFVQRHLAVVQGATHRFDEPGALEEVARLASQWFTDHLLPSAGLGPGAPTPH